MSSLNNDVGHSACRSRVRWRISLAALVVCWVVQTGFVERFDQPYPALHMPGFGMPSTKGKQYQFLDSDIYITYSDGQTVQLDRNEFLWQMPAPHAGSTLKTYFRIMPPATAPKRSWLDRLIPGFRAAKFETSKPWWKQSVAEWLDSQRSRWRPDAGDATITSVRVEWIWRERLDDGTFQNVNDTPEYLWEMSFGEDR